GRAAHDHTPFRGRAKISLPDRALIIDTTWSPLNPVLASFANRSSFLIGELLLCKLSETVVVQGNAPHDRPGFLVGHLIGNRASFLCTEAPMLRVPEELAGGHDYQEFIGAKKHLVLRLLSQNGPQGSKSFATGS